MVDLVPSQKASPARLAAAIGSPVLPVLAAFLVLAVAYSLFVPIGETPDEIGHVQFVAHVVARRSLPVQKFQANNDVGEGHQAPLFYVLAAAATAFTDASDLRTFRNNPQLDFAADGSGNKGAMVHGVGESWPFTGFVLAWHIARLVSVLCGLAGVYLAYRLGLVAFRGDGALAAAAAAFFGLNPQYVFISGAASNDALTAAFGTGLLLLGARALATPREDLTGSLRLGIVTGLAVLTKLTLLVPATLAVAALLGVRIAKRARPLRSLLVVGGAAFAVAGWWLARNLYLYGDVFALNIDRWQNPSLIRSGPPDPALIRGLLFVARDSYFARFGWMNVTPPIQVYDWLTGFLAVAAVGLVVHFLLRLIGRRPGPTRASTLLLGLGFFLAMLLAQAVFAVGKGPSAYQGRYLFAASGGLAVGVVAGLAQLLAFRGGRLLSVVLGVGGVAFSVYCLFWVIVPAYPSPLSFYPPSKDVQPQVVAAATLGDHFELVGYQVDESSWHSGGRGAVTLYWRSLKKAPVDYTVFVQLIGPDGRLLAQSDSQPLQGRFPTSAWLPGETVLDAHSLDLASVAPGSCRLFVGMYNLDDMRRLPVRLADGEQSDRLEVAREVGAP